MPQLLFTPSNGQIAKLQSAMKKKESISIHVSPIQLGGKFAVEVAEATLNRIKKNANQGKGSVVKITQKTLTQLRKENPQVGGRLPKNWRPPPFIGRWEDPIAGDVIVQKPAKRGKSITVPQDGENCDSKTCEKRRILGC